MDRSIEERLRRLEKANRWLMVVCAGLVVVPLLAVVGWQAKQEASDVPEVVRARKFELVNGSGKVLAELEADEDGTRLAIMHESGQQQAVLFMHRGDPGLVLYDEEGKDNAWFTIVSGSPSLFLFGQSPKTAVQLEVVDNEPEITVDWGLERRAVLSADEGGLGFSFYEPYQKLRTQLSLTSAGVSGMAFFDKEGKETYRIPPDKP